MPPKVSIIVPVYNGELFIEECIESILAQSFKAFELLIVNDGSVDNTSAICKKLAKQDKRMKIIHKRNAGPGSARNVGIRYSRGDYIGFVDSDDTVRRDMYEKMYSLIKKNNADICSCGYQEVNNKKLLQSVRPLNGEVFIEGEKIQKELERSLVNNKILGYASLCNKLFKRSLITENNLLVNEELRVAEDLCFNLIACFYSKKLCAINEALYVYRRFNEESLMNKGQKSFYTHLEGRKEIINTLRKIKVGEGTYRYCIKYENSKTISQYLTEIISIYFSDFRPKVKYRQINNLVHECDFMNAIENFSKKELIMKARLLVKIINVYLFIENKFKRAFI